MILLENLQPPIAAIDVGSNSFHLVIASVNDKGIIRVHGRAKEMVRLGSGGGDMKFLEPEAIERGIATLKRFAAMGKQANAITKAIATSAIREADNKDEFLERAGNEAGIDVEVVSGLEEARLTYIGALHAVPILHKRALIFDIGGGSAEMLIGAEGEVIDSYSIKLGAIRLTQRFFPGGLASRDRIAKCRDFIKGELAPILSRLLDHGFETVAATSGTAHAIGNMILAANGQRPPDTINGVVFTRKEFLAAIKTLANAKTPLERTAIPGLDSGRADIILAGALIIEQILLGLNIREIALSAFALREGIVINAAQQQRYVDTFHHLSHLRRETVYNLCDLYRVNMPHAEHVSQIALRLFDDLQNKHLLGDKERELLEAAALLHDVGYHISPDQHHKHSYYIILNCVMPGFTNDEAEVIANVARYHRKSHPKRKHENFLSISPAKQRIICILAGILRIAEGFDRRQQQLTASVRATCDNKTINIFAAQLSHSSIDIELWGANRRRPLLEQVLGLKIAIRAESPATQQRNL